MNNYTLELKLNGNKIEDMAFTGHGCAISQASTSIMIDTLKGKTIEEAKEIIETFIEMIKREEKDEEKGNILSAVVLCDADAGRGAGGSLPQIRVRGAPGGGRHRGEPGTDPERVPFGRLFAAFGRGRGDDLPRRQFRPEADAAGRRRDKGFTVRTMDRARRHPPRRRPGAVPARFVYTHDTQ